MRIFTDLKAAIHTAQAEAPSVVAFVKGSGWIVYSPVSPVAGSEPDLLCVGLGRLPIALSDVGAEAFLSLIKAES